MKKIGIIIFLAALTVGIVLASMFSWGKVAPEFIDISFGSGVKGSGNVVTEKREVNDFRSVDVGGVFLVEIVAQKDFSVEVEADDNLLQYIITDVSGGTLELKTEKRLNTHSRIRVRVYAPDIEKLEVGGASHTTLRNLANDALRVDSGGASKVTLEGRTGNLNIDMGGASRVDAGGLSAVNVTVDGGGASKAIVTVSRELNADLGGASRLEYSGNPQHVKKKTSGGSTVSQHD